MFEAVEGLLAEHAELEPRLADPSIHTDQALSKRLNQRYAELSAVVHTYRDWQQLTEDVEAAGELAARGPVVRRRGGRAGERRRDALLSGCAGCWCRATRPTARTRSSR